MPSGDEIFRELQAREDEEQARRKAAAARADDQWRRAILDVLPQYRAQLPALQARCKDPMTRITVHTSRLEGRFKKRKVQHEAKTAGWYMTVGCLLLSGLRILIGSLTERTGPRGGKVQDVLS